PHSGAPRMGGFTSGEMREIVSARRAANGRALSGSRKGVAMHWSAEEVVLVVTGALLIVIVGASFLPKVTLSSMSRVTFAIGAAVFIGAAVALARLEEVRYPPLLWLLPLVPIIIIGVLV